jgi:hypothetical protein
VEAIKMQYEYLENAGKLEIEYKGRLLDANSLGILQINLQEMADLVALNLVEAAGLLGRYYAPYGFLRHFRREIPHRSIIRVEVRELKVGSLYQEVVFYIPNILADPDVRAVLQGLAGTIIWEIGKATVRGIKLLRNKKPVELPPPTSNPREQFDISPNLRDIGIAIAENADDEGAQIIFRSRYAEGENEAIFTIPGKGNYPYDED